MLLTPTSLFTRALRTSTQGARCRRVGAEHHRNHAGAVHQTVGVCEQNGVVEPIALIHIFKGVIRADVISERRIQIEDDNRVLRHIERVAIAVCNRSATAADRKADFAAAVDNRPRRYSYPCAALSVRAARRCYYAAVVWREDERPLLRYVRSRRGFDCVAA